MRTRTLTLDTPDGPMELFEAAPDDKPRGGVIVVQEAFGLVDHIRDVTGRLAGAGYLAVAPAYFHRAGGGTAPYGDFSKVFPLFEGLDDEGILVDTDAALAHLRQAGLTDASVGLVGFCFGGRVSFLVAARRAIGAAVGFYGGGIVTARFPQFPPLVGEASSLRTPWLGLFGDQDPSIPVDDVEAIRGALVDAPVSSEVVRYADADHGFNRDVGDHYDPEAAADAWARTLTWFATHLRS